MWLCVDRNSVYLELVHGMELRSLKGCIDLQESQVNILGRQQLLEHFDLQSTNISRWGSLPKPLAVVA